jgi:hypothetical protein
VHVRVRSLSQLASSLLLAAHVAAAEPVAPDCPEQDPTICGRKHFEVGTQAFEKGDYSAAAGEFQAALSQRSHPVIRFNLALSLARLGKPSAALEQLRLVQSDEAAEKDLRARAEREQRSAEQALARVTFRLSDPTRERVELDGAPIQLSREGELSLDPGNHHVRVISNSSVVLDQDLELSPGERVELRVGERSRRIDLVVVPDTAPVQSTTPKAPAPPPAPLPAPRALLSPVWFYSAIGATAVFSGLTLWSGLDTKSAYDGYKQDLPTLSQAQADERVRDGHSRELRTNLLLAGSLVCGAGSAVLGIWFVDFSGKQQASVGLTPQSVVLSGRF